MELYNPTDKHINLGSVYISDEQLNPLKHQFPADIGFVPAKGFKTVCSTIMPLTIVKVMLLTNKSHLSWITKEAKSSSATATGNSSFLWNILKPYNV